MKANIKKTSLLKNNQGISMVSILISFALLMVLSAAFYQVQSVSRNMMMDAKDYLFDQEDFLSAFYQDETAKVRVDDTDTVLFSGEDGSFYIDVYLYRATYAGVEGQIYYYEDAD